MATVAGTKNPHYKNVISVLITDQQYRALKRRIRRTGGSVSGHMRTLLINDLEESGLYVFDEDVPEEGSSILDDAPEEGE